ncbi:class I SAM-dependent methyltransferase [bacterium]|nr:class I SAM-dependent methyltransferase [bacterium]
MPSVFLSKLRNFKRSRYTFNSHERRRWVAAFAATVPAGAAVLDAGAGSGQYGAMFAHCNYRTQDFGKEPGTLGRYAQLDYECDITDIPVRDGAFDIVLCLEVLEHLPRPEAALAELGRVLKSGGRLLLSAPLGSFLHQEPYHYYGGFTPHWYRKFLPETGFAIESLERNQGFFSLFGQETLRFHGLLRPAGGRGLCLNLALGALWAASVPLALLLPVLGRQLDRLGLESMATVGYHVVARKAPGAE